MKFEFGRSGAVRAAYPDAFSRFRAEREDECTFSIRCERVATPKLQLTEPVTCWRYVRVTMEDSDPPGSMDTAMYNVLTMCEMGVSP